MIPMPLPRYKGSSVDVVTGLDVVGVVLVVEVAVVVDVDDDLWVGGFMAWRGLDPPHPTSSTPSPRTPTTHVVVRTIAITVLHGARAPTVVLLLGARPKAARGPPPMPLSFGPNRPPYG